jgi:hypothetical protein
MAQVNTTKAATTSAVKVPVVKPGFLANASYAGGETIPSKFNFRVNFTRTVFDEANNFSVANGEFVAPSAGLYHFDIRISWMQFTAPGVITVNLNRAALATWASSSQLSSTTQRIFDSNFGALIKMPAGEKVMIYLQQDSGAPQKFQQVQLWGYKVD